MNKFFSKCGKWLAGASVAITPVIASAAVDVTAVTGAFGDASTGVAAIALVMLGVVAAGIAVKWVLGFLLG